MHVFVKEGKHLYVSMFACADMRVCTYIYMHKSMCYMQLTKCITFLGVVHIRAKVPCVQYL